MINSGEKSFVVGVPSLQACCQECNILDAREITLYIRIKYIQNIFL